MTQTPEALCQLALREYWMWEHINCQQVTVLRHLEAEADQAEPVFTAADQIAAQAFTDTAIALQNLLL